MGKIEGSAPFQPLFFASGLNELGVTFIKVFTDRQAIADAVKFFDLDGGPHIACGFQNPAAAGIRYDVTVVIGHVLVFIPANAALPEDTWSEKSLMALVFIDDGRRLLMFNFIELWISLAVIYINIINILS